MKKVLLIGDFRDCPNYGAIGTTEALLELLKPRDCCNGQNYDEIEIKTIPWRSLNSPAPEDGWSQTAAESIHNSAYSLTPHSLKEKIQDKFDNSFLMDEYRIIKKHIKRLQKRNNGFEIHKYHVPYSFSDFESYSQKVINGDCLQYEKNMIDWADIVIINGEGSIVSGTDKNGYYHLGGLYVLYIAYLSKIWLKKKTYMINHTVDPQNRDIYHMISKVFPPLDAVYVREPLSLDVLSRHCAYDGAQYVPDALFSFKAHEKWKPSAHIKSSIDFTKPYICIGDTSGFYVGRDSLFDVESMYDELIDKMKSVCEQIIFVVGFGRYYAPVMNTIRKKRLPFLTIHNSSYVDLYHVFKSAEIFVSGRWHTSILSLLAETPILLFGSDSHKTEALYTMLEYPYRFFDYRTLALNVDEIISETKKVIASDNSCYFEQAKVLAEESKKNREVLFEECHE